MGRPVEDMVPEFRDWIIDFGDSGYLARYRVDRKSVTILVVRNQSEVPAALLRRFRERFETSRLSTTFKLRYRAETVGNSMEKFLEFLLPDQHAFKTTHA